VNVEKFWDDLRLGVICLSNLVIAGSPRNIYRYRPTKCCAGVEHWMVSGKKFPGTNQTPNTIQQ
jgi:hypothetical protein